MATAATVYAELKDKQELLLARLKRAAVPFNKATDPAPGDVAAISHLSRAIAEYERIRKDCLADAAEMDRMARNARAEGMSEGNVRAAEAEIALHATSFARAKGQLARARQAVEATQDHRSALDMMRHLAIKMSGFSKLATGGKPLDAATLAAMYQPLQALLDDLSAHRVALADADRVPADLLTLRVPVRDDSGRVVTKTVYTVTRDELASFDGPRILAARAATALGMVMPALGIERQRRMVDDSRAALAGFLDTQNAIEKIYTASPEGDERDQAAAANIRNLLPDYNQRIADMAAAIEDILKSNASLAAAALPIMDEADLHKALAEAKALLAEPAPAAGADLETVGAAMLSREEMLDGLVKAAEAALARHPVLNPPQPAPRQPQPEPVDPVLENIRHTLADILAHANAAAALPQAAFEVLKNRYNLAGSQFRSLDINPADGAILHAAFRQSAAVLERLENLGIWGRPTAPNIPPQQPQPQPQPQAQPAAKPAQPQATPTETLSSYRPAANGAAPHGGLNLDPVNWKVIKGMDAGLEWLFAKARDVTQSLADKARDAYGNYRERHQADQPPATPAEPSYVNAMRGNPAPAHDAAKPAKEDPSWVQNMKRERDDLESQQHPAAKLHAVGAGVPVPEAQHDVAPETRPHLSPENVRARAGSSFDDGAGVKHDETTRRHQRPQGAQVGEKDDDAIPKLFTREPKGSDREPVGDGRHPALSMNYLKSLITGRED